MRGEGGKGSIAVRKHESSSQSCEVCVSVCVGCNGSLGCCCCCEGIHRTESNTSEKECAAECQCKAQSERATERERNSLSFDCALSAVRSLLFTLSTVHSLSLLLWHSLGTSLSVVCVGIHTLCNETHHNHAPLGQLSPLGALAQLLLLARK